ncbi:ABC transporter permease [Streptosporangium carneum]|uniref:Transport permease protein n=1 Tax=Streptosporangium carneum TaxID=47481 RepID=A0A9W6I3I8_9ACTN|nr:ABC transporter permease [Streptosporangium carneum]GLK11002.1 transport permease protein [Streptosporangium carneum]
MTAAGASRGATLPIATMLVARRAVLTFLRTPQLVVLGTVQLVGFLMTFRYVFGGAFDTRGGLSYVDFAVPGFVAAGVPFTLIGTAVVMAEDLQRGFVDRLRSLPFPSAAVLAGRVLADGVVLAWSLAIATLTGFAIGFRPHGSVPQALAAFGLCLVFGLAFSWVFITLGLLAGNGQAAQGMAMLVFPLTFGSSAYVPVETMPDWLRAFADNQPVTWMANAVRALTLGDHARRFLGHDAAYYVTGSLVWAVVIMVVFFCLAVARFRRG